MKAIIIEEKDVTALLDKLKLTQFQNSRGTNHYREGPAAVDEMHRWFHFVVVKWLQEQGASCIGGS